MNFELAEEHRMLKDLVGRFVADELLPLEAGVLAREAAGQGLSIRPPNASASTRSPASWASGAWTRRRTSAAPTCPWSPWSG
jgi:acyl-CoA dehydrogenase